MALRFRVLAAVAAALPLVLAAGWSGDTTFVDDAVFHSNATAGRNAFTGLDMVIILAAVLIAAGCAWGLSRRLAEHR